jgi:ParB-like chromosome segregation protein Spo0J
MSRPKPVWKSPADLRPHPLHKELYGPPTANSAYKDIKASMARHGFDERQPLLITEDDRIVWGVTRWAAAKSVGLALVPCEVFVPAEAAQAELEIERELIRGNTYRVKTQTILAKEQRKMLEVEADLARRRMGEGSDGGPSKATDRVGKLFGESGKTVQRRLKVLRAIEEAETAGQRKKAEQLTELLNAGKTLKALDVAQGKAPKAKPPKVEVPPTIHEHANKAYSEFFNGCAKAQYPAELQVLEAALGRMRDDLESARRRVAPGP